MSLHPPLRNSLTLWGHRGGRGSGLPPENSLGAFARAMADGADGIELDVFLSRDEELVVFHDATLDKLSDGTGPLEDRTLAQLRQLRLKAIAGGLSSERIPTLREVLALVHGWRQAAAADGDGALRRRAQSFVVNIETKGLGIARHVAQEIGHWLAAGWSAENFLNSSFDMRSVRQMRALLPQLPVGTLFDGPLPGPAAPWDLTVDELRHCIDGTRDIQPRTINVTLPTMRLPGAVELIRTAGARPVAWTCGEIHPGLLDAAGREALLRFLAEQDVVLITDYPGALRRLAQGAAG